MWVLLLSRPTDPPGGYAERRELESGSLTIGRAAPCDWIINDETRWISSKHARFEVRGLDLFITDTSTNGVALNQETNRIARNVPVQIRVGDKLLFSNGVAIEVATPFGGVGARSPSELRPPPPAQPAPRIDQPDIWFNGRAPWQDPAAPPGGGHDFLAQPAATAAAPPLPTGAPPSFFAQSHEFLAPASAGPAMPPSPMFPPAASPLDEAFRRPILAPIEPAAAMFDIPADWQSGSAGAAFPAFEPAAPPSPPPPAPAQTPRPMTGFEAQGRPAPQAPAADLSAAWAAFCEGAEIAPGELDPPSLETMRQLGTFYRQTVLGLSDLIRDRASFKDEFRVERTQLGIGRNNPLKYLAPFEAAKIMLKKPMSGFLGAEEAVRESLEDVKRHQLAMLAGVQNALRAVFERLSPATVDAAVKKLGAGKGPQWLGRAPDPWAIYQTMFQTLKQEAGTSAASVMSVAFREGYESFLRRN